MKTTVLKKLILIACSSMVFLSVLAAEGVTINWQWEAADQDVIAFRYQLNAENPDGWTIVDVSETSLEIGPVEAEDSQVLYIQQSYDGEYWSPSAALAYNPKDFGVIDSEELAVGEFSEELVALDAKPVEEPREGQQTLVEDSWVEGQELDEESWAEEWESWDDSFVWDEEDELFLDEFDPWMEVPDTESETMSAQVAPMPQPLTSSVTPAEAMRRIDVTGGVGTVFPLSFTDPNAVYTDLKPMILPAISIDYVQRSIAENDSRWIRGYRVGLGYQGYEADATASHLAAVDVHGMMMLTYPMGDRFSFEVSGGLTFLFTSKAIHAQDYLGFFIGPMVHLQLNYQVNETWSLGLQADSRFLFGDKFSPYEFSGIARLGLGYTF